MCMDFVVSLRPVEEFWAKVKNYKLGKREKNVWCMYDSAVCAIDTCTEFGKQSIQIN